MHLAQPALNVFEQQAALGGEADFARAAFEQREFDAFLEFANGVADRAGGDAQLLGGHGKGFGSAGGFEDSEGRQGHASKPIHA